MSSAPRRPWLAALLALLCTGLGHLYAGRLAAAVWLQALALALAVALSGALRTGPGATAAVTVASFFFWIGQALHAARAARRAAAAPRTASSRPPALVLFYAANLAISAVVVPEIRVRVGHTLYAPSGSMIPTIQVGDVLAVAAGRPAALRGAVVLHAAPAGAPRPEPLVKRVVAIGGDTVELREGALWVNGAPVPREATRGPCTLADRAAGGEWREEPCLDFVETLDGRAYHTRCTPNAPCGDVGRQVVPEGRVWLAGDRRDRSADSRVLGPLPESAILGEVRWVILSWGPRGPRWDRIGREIR